MHDKCNFKKWIKILKDWDVVSLKAYKQNRASRCDYKLSSQGFYNTIESRLSVKIDFKGYYPLVLFLQGVSFHHIVLLFAVDQYLF